MKPKRGAGQGGYLGDPKSRLTGTLFSTAKAEQSEIQTQNTDGNTNTQIKIQIQREIHIQIRTRVHRHCVLTTRVEKRMKYK